MEWFSRSNGELFAEQVSVANIAEQFGTPTYIYSRAGFEAGYKAYEEALSGHPHLICYAVKANSNLAVLNVLAKLGAGFDLVSVGELERVLAAGGDPAKVVFSGVGKQRHEIRRALEVGIHCFNVESEVELERIQEEAAAMNKVASISMRVNPDVDAQTHPYISTGLKDNKFGIDISRAPEVYQRAAELPNIDIVGVDCHIGSQLTTKEPFIDALDRLLILVDQLAERGIKLKHLDIGGGLGISYDGEVPPTPTEYLSEVRGHLMAQEKYQHLAIVVEPGRSIAGNAGLLATEVELIKKSDHKNFVVVDAAMNDLLRPSIYSAYHGIEPVQQDDSKESLFCDVVGPICETGDFLGKDRDIKVAEGDLLAVMSSGAYGFGMSSNYNSRNRIAEVMVDGDKVHQVRRRETIQEQFATESLLPEE
ncbi:diaminopimelate decarboxylase [Endozoicomonas sp. OPT23]|uniref:diaminopimelate decarboxylase n=1 Tax=Endozoicomonas sp. OPT23 TaxID=2072845 RepID=UPI00129ABE9D|nr:diaminopimelate decarboxylase [Endozoicomonas sp. OPT23]MRI33066.1 diaminopimelate decarboxylase [Endozoicomonas sp. OPT23]